jgi:hypothetical protein
MLAETRYRKSQGKLRGPLAFIRTKLKNNADSVVHLYGRNAFLVVLVVCVID